MGWNVITDSWSLLAINSVGYMGGNWIPWCHHPITTVQTLDPNDVTITTWRWLYPGCFCFTFVQCEEEETDCPPVCMSIDPTFLQFQCDWLEHFAKHLIIFTVYFATQSSFRLIYHITGKLSFNQLNVTPQSAQVMLYLGLNCSWVCCSSSLSFSDHNFLVSQNFGFKVLALFCPILSDMVCRSLNKLLEKKPL